MIRHRLPYPSRRAKAEDRGAITLFVCVIAVALILATGLVVDGGAKIRALQRADEAAREAARAGSQMILVGPAVRGEGAQLDPARAAGAARAYLAAAGVDGTVSASPTLITVTARTTFRPVFLGVAGVGATAVTGTATARPVTSEAEEVP